MKPPINMEIAGVNRTFEYGKTECHVYRNVSDYLYSNIQAEEYGTQKIYLFNVPRQIMFLVGQEVFADHGLKPKQLNALTTAMQNTVGWEADLVIKDECPEDVKERYHRLATVALQGTVHIPKEWYA